MEQFKQVDLPALIGQRVKLHRRGKGYVGLCPFHSEKTPSFSVLPNKFHCFGCGATGDALDYIQRTEDMSLLEAAKYLSEMFGIPFEREDPHQELRQGLTKLLADFESGRSVVQEYLSSRGITPELAQAWKIGYGRASAYVKGSGLWNEAGNFLLKDRIIFPIFDRSGQILSFAGRVRPGQDGPKYINGQATELYDKSTALYGIHRAARSIQDNGALLVEGYTDVILLHSIGKTQAVASCGTGITEGHLSMLSTLTGRLVIATDPDDAGVKAALRTIRMAAAFNLSTEVLIASEDPADAVLHGRFEENTVPGMLFMKQHSDKPDFELLEDCLKIIIEYKNIVKKDLEIKNLSNIFAIPIRSIHKEIWQLEKQRRSAGSQPGHWSGKPHSSSWKSPAGGWRTR